MSGTDRQIVTSVGDSTKAPPEYLNRFTVDNATSVTLNDEFYVQNLNFTKDGVLNLIGNKTDITTSITANNMGTISFSGGNARIKTDIGAANARLKEITLGAGVNLNIDAGKALYTTITGPGNVTFAGASNSPELDLGKAGSNLGTVTFGGLTEVRDVYANILNIGANDVTVKNAHGADSTLVAGSVLKIKDGGKVGRVSGLVQ
jgi:hypothetical protein